MRVMSNTCRFRVCLVALAVLIGLAVVGMGVAHAQVWLCGKCNCRVGSGPNPPKQCPHCKSRLRGSFLAQSSGSKSSTSSSSSAEKQKEYPIAILAVIGVGVAIVGFMTISKHAGRAAP